MIATNISIFNIYWAIFHNILTKVIFSAKQQNSSQSKLAHNCPEKLREFGKCLQFFHLYGIITNVLDPDTHGSASYFGRLDPDPRGKNDPQKYWLALT